MAKLIVVEDVIGPSVRGRGGAAMYVLQWAHGLRRLGHEVLLLEVLDEPPAPDAARALSEAVECFWRGGEAAVLHANRAADGGVTHVAGASIEQVMRFANRAAAVITLAAHYRPDPWPLIAGVRPRILVDQDPGYTHLWASEGDPADVYGEHDVYFTVGANIGGERCRLPTLGIDWHPVYNPVVLEWWRPDRPIKRDRFTTVTSGRDYGYLEWEGQVLGPKVEQLERLLDLPRRSGDEIELAMDLHMQDPGRVRLEEHGWRIEDPAAVQTPEGYRGYVEGSLAELSVAKGGYVGTRSGWFSDRSACYLAAGRPVVLQSTGFEDVLPAGKGLFAFHTIDEAAEAMARIRADYPRHSRAAREIACEHLDSDRVLRGLLQTAGIDS